MTIKEERASASTGPMPSSTATPAASRVRQTPHGLRAVRRAKTPTRAAVPETYELNTDHEDWDDAEMVNPNDTAVNDGQ